jgi:hypothetical protein
LKELKGFVVLAMAICVLCGAYSSSVAQKVSTTTSKPISPSWPRVFNRITVAQLKEIKENIVILKEAKAERQPGAPVDLMTPYLAATKVRATMASVKEA